MFGVKSGMDIRGIGADIDSSILRPPTVVLNPVSKSNATSGSIKMPPNTVGDVREDKTLPMIKVLSHRFSIRRSTIFVPFINSPGRPPRKSLIQLPESLVDSRF